MTETPEPVSNGADSEQHVQSASEASAPRKKRGLLRRALFFLLWCLIGTAGAAAWDAHRFLTTPASADPKEVVISILPGATFDRVAWDLKKAGAVTDVTRFRILAYAKKALGQVKAGEYMVSTGWTPEQVLAQITQGKAVLYRLSIREGLAWWEIAKEVEAQGFAKFDDFKEIIHDPEFLRANAVPFDNAEGFLYPETYLMPKPRSPLDKEQARIVAKTMVDMFWKKNQAVWAALPLRKGVIPLAALTPRAGNATAPVNGTAGIASSVNGTAARNATTPARAPSGRNGSLPSANNAAAAGRNTPAANGTAAGNTTAPLAPQSPFRADGPQKPSDVDPEALKTLVVLASLVEEETAVPAERARVAGVYTNRLNKDMLLQCDPTIPYGIGESFRGPIRRSQLDDAANLYNTYQHPGLPPGPICSPGAAAINAAAVPEKHGFIFFVATGLGDGGHIFSKTLSEHNRAVELYRARVRGGQ